MHIEQLHAAAIPAMRQHTEALPIITPGTSSRISAEVRWGYADEHGDTRITLVPTDHTQSSHIPDGGTAFDLAYAHRAPGSTTLTQHALSEYMGPNSAFVHELGNTDLTTVVTRLGASVMMPLATLDSRQGLLHVAHEIGHTQQAPLMDQLKQFALHGTVDTAPGGSSLLHYGPALVQLDQYVAAHPKLIEDSYRADEILAAAAKGTPYEAEIAGLDPTDKWERIIRSMHPEAHTAISAVSEADAWMRALKLVDANVVHPGMSQEAMLDEAAARISTYDEGLAGNPHRSTLDYALKSA